MIVGVSEIALTVAIATVGLLFYVFYNIFTKKPPTAEEQPPSQARKESESENQGRRHFIYSSDRHGQFEREFCRF